MKFRHFVPRERSKDEAFASPERCIYCDSTDGLTLEHIVPDGIYGNLVLPRASCHVCLKKIHKYESWVIQTHFGMARMAMGIHSKKKRGPKYRRRSTFVSISENGTIREREAYSAMPHVVVTTHFNRRAVIFGGKMPGEREGGATFALDNMENEDDIIRSEAFRVDDGLQFAAKVAHGYAVACLGIDGFTPYLRDIILGQIDRSYGSFGLVPWYVGITEAKGAPDPVALHRLGLRIERRDCSITPNSPSQPRELVIVHLALFMGYNLPIYEIVVGEVSPSAASTNSR